MLIYHLIRIGLSLLDKRIRPVLGIRHNGILVADNTLIAFYLLGRIMLELINEIFNRALVDDNIGFGKSSRLTGVDILVQILNYLLNLCFHLNPLIPR